jgi:hypothetical protein
MQAHSDLNLRAHMPPSTVEHQQDMLALACPNRLGELGESDCERRNRNRREQEPDRPTSTIIALCWPPLSQRVFLANNTIGP